MSESAYAIKISFMLAGITCLILVPLAIVVARWMVQRDFPGKGLLEALLLLPLVLPPTVLGYYLLVAMAPDSLLGAAVLAVTGKPIAFSFSGVVIASLIANIPFAVQPIQRSFEAIPQSVKEAAWVSGLSAWQTFVKVELPLAWPGIVTAVALVGAHTLGEFGVILMVGGNIPGETQTVSIAIYDRMQAMRDAEAGYMALLLLGFSVLALAVVQVTARQRRLRLAS